MKNILIISFFHSSQNQVGAIRTQRFAQYLPKLGWKPYVLTKKPMVRNSNLPQENQDTFYVPSFPLNKPFHLESLIWIPLMLVKAIKIIKKIPIEVVLISCPPFHQAMVGVLLKKLFGIKLVIDYRDAWGLNPYRQRLNRFRRFMLQGDSLLEQYLLRNTNLLIVSHQEMKERYRHHFKLLKDRIEVVYNGFDPEKIGTSPEVLFPEFTILHLGNFYGGQKTRNPDTFLTALQQVITEKNIPIGQLQVLFIGERYYEIEKMIIDKGLLDYVSYLDRVSHDLAMEYLKKAHVLLLIETMNVMTTKVFEYLATGKPMLCLIRKGGELESLILKSSSNAYILRDDLNHIKKAIESCWETYQKGDTKAFVNGHFYMRFSRMEQTRHLAELLDHHLVTKGP